MSGPFFERFEMRIFCPLTLVNDVLISGREILRSINVALKFKRRWGEPRITIAAEQYLLSERSKRIVNFRTINQVKKVASIIALTESQKEISEAHLAEAFTYQRIKEIEHHC